MSLPKLDWESSRQCLITSSTSPITRLVWAACSLVLLARHQDRAAKNLPKILFFNLIYPMIWNFTSHVTAQWLLEATLLTTAIVLFVGFCAFGVYQLRNTSGTGTRRPKTIFSLVGSISPLSLRLLAYLACPVVTLTLVYLVVLAAAWLSFLLWYPVYLTVDYLEP